MAERPTKDGYFTLIAQTTAARSTCNRLAVGCVLVDSYGNTISTGYNGSPSGLPHCLDVGCMIDERTGSCVRTVHAEINALLRGESHRISGGTAYVTHMPCWNCFLALASARVRRVVYLEDYRNGDRQRQHGHWFQGGFELYTGGA